MYHSRCFYKSTKTLKEEFYTISSGYSTNFIPSIGAIVMASSLHCMLLLSTPANVNQHSLISDWLDTTGSISLKNMLSEKNSFRPSH